MLAASITFIALGLWLALRKLSAAYPDGTLRVNDADEATAQLVNDLRSWGQR